MKVSAGTIARTVCLAMALVNQVLTVTGHSIIPIQDEDIQMLVSLLFTIITAVVSWWKNNSFTEAALAGDMVMEQMKVAKEKEGE